MEAPYGCYSQRESKTLQTCFLGDNGRGEKEQNPKTRVFKYPLFILRAIDPEQCQMFGGYSKTKRTIRETGWQDQPDIKISRESQRGKFPLPEVPHKRNPSPALLLKVFSSQRHSNTPSSLEREGTQCRLPLRAEDPTLR